MGSADLSVPILQALVESEFCQVVLVVTQPDRRSGRSMKIKTSSVKREALRIELPVFQPEKIRSPDSFQTLSLAKPDLMVVAAYGQILPASILELPEFGCLNVHTSLLPKYRGAAPIQYALLKGEKESGVTIMKMDEGMDTGDILSMESVDIHEEDTAQTLHDRLAILGATCLLKTIPGYVQGSIQPRPQDTDDATYAAKLKKHDGRISWAHSSHDIWNRIRAFTPWPGTFTYDLSGTKPKRIKIGKAVPAESLEISTVPGTVISTDDSGIRIACGNGKQSLYIKEIQPDGKRAMSVSEFLAGHRIPIGSLFGDPEKLV